MMLVGEQPGDQEDRAGRPFVGPAGRLLDRALVAAGIDRDAVYVTNAVKHFKFKQAQRGKRRIHQTPSRTEVVSCRPWLLAELTAVGPEVVVLMGAISENPDRASAPGEIESPCASRACRATWATITSGVIGRTRLIS
jgi:uracil-DNA glycosylase family 4